MKSILYKMVARTFVLTNLISLPTNSWMNKISLDIIFNE